MAVLQNMDGAIDYIYFTSTTTDEIGNVVSVTQAQYFVPFLDFFMVFLVFCFTILATIVFYKTAYSDPAKLNIKNYVSIAKKRFHDNF